MLARREAHASVWFYVKHNWQRQLFFAIAYLTMAGALWSINWRSISVAFLAYFMGRTVRDIQWYRSLAKEWPTTAELIDWPRVEAIANETKEESVG